MGLDYDEIPSAPRPEETAQPRGMAASRLLALASVVFGLVVTYAASPSSSPPLERATEAPRAAAAAPTAAIATRTTTIAVHQVASNALPSGTTFAVGYLS